MRTVFSTSNFSNDKKASQALLTVIGGGREDLGLLGGNDGVTGDQLGEDSASSFDTESKGADVNKDDVFGSFFTREDTTLNSSAVGDSLVGVDSLRGLLASKELLKELLDLGDTSGTANKNDLRIE
jgi:hypothetical protein